MALRKILQLFLSLGTALWLLVFILIMFFAGAFVMPGRKEFQTLHSMPMFEWLVEQPVTVTWWLWGLIGVIALLSVNTLLCSIDSIIRKGRTTQWLLLMSPQIIHIGFLFILLAHLLSAAGGFQQLSAAREGSYLRISGGNVLHVKNIDIRTDSRGYMTDWAVDVEFMDGADVLSADRVKPNDPALHGGLNISVKDLRGFPQKAVLLQVSSEPGAVWALAGGIFVIAGTAILIILRIKREK